MFGTTGIGGNGERDRFDDSDIVGHVVPLRAVATSHGANEVAMLIDQRNAQSVKLQFTANVHVLSSKPLFDTTTEGGDLFGRIGVAE